MDALICTQPARRPLEVSGFLILNIQFQRIIKRIKEVCENKRGSTLLAQKSAVFSEIFWIDGNA